MTTHASTRRPDDDTAAWNPVVVSAWVAQSPLPTSGSAGCADVKRYEWDEALL